MRTTEIWSPWSLRIATLAAPLIVAMPVVPSGDTATWLTSPAGSAIFSVLIGLTCNPSIASSVTVPALRSAT